jgi:hypothetical protein
MRLPPSTFRHEIAREHWTNSVRRSPSIRLHVGSDTDEAAAGLIEVAMRAQRAGLG